MSDGIYYLVEDEKTGMTIGIVGTDALQRYNEAKNRPLTPEEEARGERLMQRSLKKIRSLQKKSNKNRE